MSFGTVVREVGWDSVFKAVQSNSNKFSCRLPAQHVGQMRRMFVTDHYLTVGSQCEDIKERQYLHKKTEVLRSARNRIKNWHDANSTDSKKMCSVGYRNKGPLRWNYNTRNCEERMLKVEQVQDNCRNAWLHILNSVCNS